MKTLMLLALPASLLTGTAAVKTAVSTEAVESSMTAEATSHDKDARKGKKGPGAIIKKHDDNGDHKISVAEAAGTKLEARFDRVDANNDGFVTARELAKFRAERKAKKHANGKKKFAERDANKDGKLSRDEVAGTKLDKRFDRIDADKDGALTKAELKAARDERRARKNARCGEGDHKSADKRADKPERKAAKATSERRQAKKDKRSKKNRG